jgi:exodeoxyribonuclease III
VLVTRPLASHLKEAGIDREARKGKQPSDHAPVWARFEL